MANEKIVNRENLKAFRQAYDERLKNGSLVPSKSLQAQSIQAVSVESGAIQETPFINQGTGTANGTDIVDTSPVGKHLEKQGNSVVVNQQLPNPNFVNSSNWGAYNPSYQSLSVSNGEATLTALMDSSLADSLVSTALSVPQGHKVLVLFNAKASVSGRKIRVRTPFVGNDVELTTNYKMYACVGNFGSTNALRFQCYDQVAGDTFTFNSVYLIDIYQWFNGDIPSDLESNPENFFRYYNGSLAYNTGTLVNADGRYLECGQSRNVWDEVAEQGTLTDLGSNYSDTTHIRSKNYIKVIPNTQYRVYSGGGAFAKFCAYDKEHKFIQLLSQSNYVITTPANCSYIRFAMGSGYGNTYKNDITISLYYETGDGYDKYYPYVEPKVYDTGTEVLRKAGNVKDYKEPDGTIHRLVGTYTLTGEEDWQDRPEFNDCDRFVLFTNTIPANAEGICNKLFYEVRSSGVISSNIGKIINNTGTQIVVNFSAKGTTTLAQFKTWLSTNNVIIQYELDTPTTEQGTPFPENIEINDYSYMAWKNSTGYVDVPQGCRIFYPADYVLFIDSVGQRTDINWDATKLVSQEQRTSDKSAQATLDTALQNAIGGTLRHQLADANSLDFLNTAWVDLGSLTWTYDGSTFVSSVISGKQTGSQIILCPLFKTTTVATGNMVDMEIKAYSTTNTLVLKDSAYTDATAFKNAMKNVLLAYEKAS